jgi:DNA polymerase II small subunit
MKSILKLFSEHGTFVQPEAMQYITSKDQPEEFASTLINHFKEYPLILTMDHIKNIEQTLPIKERPPQPAPPANKELQNKLLSELYNPRFSLTQTLIEENDDKYEDPDKEDQLQPTEEPLTEQLPKPIEIKTVKGWKPLAKEYNPEINIIKDITGKSTCEGTTQDFTKLFRNRHTVLRRTLQNQRREIANAIPINRIKPNTMKDIQLIGIVKNVRTTTNGHRLIELEDETGTATLIGLKNKPDVFTLANEVVHDEIIGINGRLSKNGDLIIIQNVIFPDISIQHNKKRVDIPLCAAFLADIHMGSKMFLEDQWHAFLKWINGDLGNKRQRDVASKIKYIIVPGDVVDGIGIYPGQEQELAISNIYLQYEALAKQFQLIPNHISLIIQPGNHDAVRPAEPQPAFEKEIRDLFSGKDISFVGNPCYFSLHDVEILSYHGQSLLDFATNIQHLKYNEPTEIMKVMLRKRHLAPTYGGYTPLAPEHTDFMIIDKVPDVFVTGHVHLATIDEYRGVTLINASSWQSQTTYQKMLNFIPDSAKLPIVNLNTGKATTMDFSQQIS